MPDRWFALCARTFDKFNNIRICLTLPYEENVPLSDPSLAKCIRGLGISRRVPGRPEVLELGGHLHSTSLRQADTLSSRVGSWRSTCPLFNMNAANWRQAEVLSADHPVEYLFAMPANRPQSHQCGQGIPGGLSTQSLP